MHAAPPLTGTVEVLDALAACIDALGAPAFEESLLVLLRLVARSEQCMIFAYGRDDSIDCLLAVNERDPAVAQELARQYVRGEFRRDPNYASLRAAMNDGTDIAPRRMVTEGMSADYRAHFFSFPDLVDKVSMAVAEGEAVYYLNLYRGALDGPFADADLTRLNRLAPLLASLVRRHFAPRRRDREQPTREELAVLRYLSDREQQVCLRLLRGHTVKSAARELDVAISTAETYRKRAYQKLGIPSRARLVALCRGN